MLVWAQDVVRVGYEQAEQNKEINEERSTERYLLHISAIYGIED